MSVKRFFSRSWTYRALMTGVMLLCAVAAFAQNVPAKPDPPRLVNDFTGMLMPAQVDALERKLDTYNDSTSTQIVIAIVETVGDYGMVDYAVKLGRTWGVGGKQFNNGVVILIAKNDHKAFIATGYGMEGPLPDATCKEIVDNDIIPSFKQQDYYGGLDKATDDIIRAAAGEYKAPPKSAQNDGSGALFFFIFLVILVVIILISRGGGGGRGGNMYSRRGLGPFLGGMIAGSLMGGGRGGGFGGGFGGGGGGGFGGFGGGSFGGGGAGGSW